MKKAGTLGVAPKVKLRSPTRQFTGAEVPGMKRNVGQTGIASDRQYDPESKNRNATKYLANVFMTQIPDFHEPQYRAGATVPIR